MSDADIHFYFDPVCPFAWMTSKWVRQVTAQRDYTVDWRFISLRMINAAVDYDSHFPPGYEAGHTAGLKLLRVAARVRADYGRDRVGSLYEAIGTQVFDTEPDERQDRGSRTFLEPNPDPHRPARDGGGRPRGHLHRCRTAAGNR